MGEIDWNGQQWSVAAMGVLFLGMMVFWAVSELRWQMGVRRSRPPEFDLMGAEAPGPKDVSAIVDFYGETTDEQPSSDPWRVRILCTCGKWFTVGRVGLECRPWATLTDGHGECVVPPDLAEQMTQEMERCDATTERMGMVMDYDAS